MMTIYPIDGSPLKPRNSINQTNPPDHPERETNMSHKYKGPGTYVAICNKTNWDGHYVKVFTIPSSGHWGMNEEDYSEVDAAWYFLNRVDSVACINAESVFPLSLFHNIFAPKCVEQLDEVDIQSAELYTGGQAYQYPSNPSLPPQ